MKYSPIKINDWTVIQQQLNWNHEPGKRHSKRMMEQPAKQLTARKRKLLG